MHFDRYVRYILEHRRTPEGVERPKAIHLGAAEGYVSRVEGRTLNTPSVADVERRAAQIEAASLNARSASTGPMRSAKPRTGIAEIRGSGSAGG